MIGKINEREARLQISKNFPWCPFCCFEGLEIDVKSGRAKDYIFCGNCGAKWNATIQEKIRSVRLISTSIDWKGRELLEKEMEPEFWQKRAWLCVLTRRTPKKSS